MSDVQSIRNLLVAREYESALALARKSGWPWAKAELELRKALAIQQPTWTVANVCLAIWEAALGGIPRAEHHAR